jgi:hypothetical protein
MVIAVIALVVSLGGTSYAAINLPKNSVGATQIKKNAITSGKVKDHSLRAKDFKAGALARGPVGPMGATGPTGPPGAKGDAGATTVKMRTGSDFTVVRNDHASGTASCQPGETATGGGVFPKASTYYPRVSASFPLPNEYWGAANDDITPTGWRVWVANDDTKTFVAPSTITMTPYVICAAP